MGLSSILEAIIASGEAQVQQIEADTSIKARQILAETSLEVQETQENVRKKTASPAYHEKARILHRAHLEALRISGNAREGLIDSAIDQARGRLASLRGDASYPLVLRRLTQEALEKLEDSLEDTWDAQLTADPRDMPILENFFCELGLELHINYELNTWGGLIVTSEDGKLVIINTLEKRLERAMPVLRRHLASLFEGYQVRASDSSGLIEVEKNLKI